MRLSAAGPMLAPSQKSSAFVAVPLWLIPPIEMMFLAHAWGNACSLLLLPCAWVMVSFVMSNRIVSSVCETEVYWFVAGLPQELDWTLAW